jgi:hypothetical protein
MLFKFLMAATLLSASVIGAQAQRNTDVPKGPATIFPMDKTTPQTGSVPPKGATQSKGAKENKGGGTKDGEATGGTGQRNGSGRGK